jgi:hypothetical protein
MRGWKENHRGEGGRQNCPDHLFLSLIRFSPDLVWELTKSDVARPVSFSETWALFQTATSIVSPSAKLGKALLSSVDCIQHCEHTLGNRRSDDVIPQDFSNRDFFKTTTGVLDHELRDVLHDSIFDGHMPACFFGRSLSPTTQNEIKACTVIRLAFSPGDIIDGLMVFALFEVTPYSCCRLSAASALSGSLTRRFKRIAICVRMIVGFHCHQSKFLIEAMPPAPSSATRSALSAWFRCQPTHRRCP